MYKRQSQWFALYYLDRIDRLVKEQLRIKGYVRYMDDFILIHRNKQYLQNCLKEINKVCNEELNLKLNQKTDVYKRQTERWTISKKQFIKDKIHLSQLQDKYHERLTEKGFDLERGIKGSRDVYKRQGN